MARAPHGTALVPQTFVMLVAVVLQGAPLRYPGCKQVPGNHRVANDGCCRLPAGSLPRSTWKCRLAFLLDVTPQYGHYVHKLEWFCMGPVPDTCPVSLTTKHGGKSP